MSTELPNAIPSKEALIRLARGGLAQGATVAIQSIVTGVLTANPYMVILGPVLNAIWKGVRTEQEKRHGVGNANWFWKIF